MFCSKPSHGKKNKKQILKTRLRIVYSEPHMSLEELHNRDRGMSVHG